MAGVYCEEAEMGAEGKVCGDAGAAGVCMRMLITGAAGSGTSTLAAALAERLGVAHLEADDFFWLPTEPPYTVQRDPTERAALLAQALDRHVDAVVAGSVMGWGAAIEDMFDLIVFLYLATEIRIDRLRQREIERFGRANPAFLDWAAQYDDGPPEGRSLAKHEAWLASRLCKVLELRGDLGISERLDAIFDEL